jgi:hypothetical protein
MLAIANLPLQKCVLFSRKIITASSGRYICGVFLIRARRRDSAPNIGAFSLFHLFVMRAGVCTIRLSGIVRVYGRGHRSHDETNDPAGD